MHRTFLAAALACLAAGLSACTTTTEVPEAGPAPSALTSAPAFVPSFAPAPTPASTAEARIVAPDSLLGLPKLVPSNDRDPALVAVVLWEAIRQAGGQASSHYS